MGSSSSSEMTAAAAGTIGKLRHDPFAMLPFCGYNMGDYFKHWINIGKKTDSEKLPKIFYVNWFRKDENGKFLWPGFGENIRVLKWIVDRIKGKAPSAESPIGWMPRYEDIDWTGLNFSKEDFEKIMTVDREPGKQELLSHEELFERMYDRLPKEIFFMRELLLSALWRSPEKWGLQPERD